MNIPDITSREVLISVIDELKYKLKARLKYKLKARMHAGFVREKADPMLESFNDLLNEFIEEWKLDKDPHCFATPPKKEEKTDE